MNIVLKRSPAYDVNWFRQYVIKSLRKTLSKFANVVQDASIYLREEKIRARKSCLLVINMISGEKIVIKDHKRDWGIAIQNTLAKAKQAIKTRADAP